MFNNNLSLISFVLLTFACSVLKLVDRQLILFCLTEPQYKNLCMSADVIRPEYVDTSESVSRIRELLLGESLGPWVTIVGEIEWVKLIKIGSIFRNTRPGTPFEARRSGALDTSGYEIFHICRSADCRFAASNSKVTEYLGSVKKPRGTKHVSKFAITAKTVAAVPGVDIPGPVEIVKVACAPKKLIAGLIVVSMLILLRLKHVLAEVDIPKAVRDSIAFALRSVLGNTLSGAWAIESGLLGGSPEFFWGKHPSYAEWITRVLVYGGVLWFFDAHLLVYKYCKSDGSLPVAPLARRRSGISEPSSVGEECCMANSLYMSLPSKLTALSPTPCRDVDCEVVHILREDHMVSKLPQTFAVEGMSLCSTHRDMYHTLRTNQACAVLQCMRLGVSGPEGKNYCALHMGQAVLPPKEVPKVKFEHDPKHDKAPEQGMDNIPENVLRSLVRRMADEDDLSDPTVVSRLTDEYGGDLLNNALRIYHLLDDKATSSTDLRDPVDNRPSIQPTEVDRGFERQKCYSFDTPMPPRVPDPIPEVLIGRVLAPPTAKLYVKPAPITPVVTTPQPPVAANPLNVFANMPSTSGGNQDRHLWCERGLVPSP